MHPAYMYTSPAKSYGMYAGCMDTRYANYDAAAGIQPAEELCVDTIPPSITLLGQDHVTIGQFSTFVDEGAVATDVVDGSVAVNVDGQASEDVFGERVLTYWAEDAAGNRASVTRRIKVVEFDECASDPCGNGATCSQTVAAPTYSRAQQRFICACLTGWEGMTCEDDVDECSSSPCLNDGRCHESLGGSRVDSVCGAVGLVACASSSGVSCVPEYFRIELMEEELEQGCRLRWDSWDEPGCTVAVDAYHCSCPPGTSGEHCAQDVDECHSSPCLHGGECYESGACRPLAADPCSAAGLVTCGQMGCVPRQTVPLDAYACQCAQGFEGQLCAADTNECDSSPCQNGGTCVDSACDDHGDDAARTCADEVVPANAFACVCIVGFTGELCTDDVNECDSNPCSNGGLCYESGAACREDYDCSAVGMQNCGTGGCVPLGTFTTSRDAFTCSCMDGFSGQLCEADVDECISSPCMNAGSCFESTTCPADEDGGEAGCGPVDGMVQCASDGSCVPQVLGALHAAIGSYSCVCEAGWSGEHCEVDIDECVSMPCRNGGLCHESGSCSGGDPCAAVSSMMPHNATGACIPRPPADAYACNCPIGFAGSLCETDIDECASNPCWNGASCAESASNAEIAPGVYRCTCAVGFSNGYCPNNTMTAYNASCGIAESEGFDASGNCDIDADECASAPCANGGSCFESAGSRLQHNDDLAIGDNACDAVPGTTTCSSGHCIVDDHAKEVQCPDVDPGTYICTCLVGFLGPTCEIDVDECASSPCMHGACVESTLCPMDNDGGEAGCGPIPGMVLCSDGACILRRLGGLHAAADSYHCICDDGWTGEHCEADIDECISSPCQNGTCVDSTTCPADEDGGEAGCGPIDGMVQCSDGSCVPQVLGALHAAIESYSCVCEAGWSGEHCEVDIDECVSMPCKNGAVCMESNEFGVACGNCTVVALRQCGDVCVPHEHCTERTDDHCNEVVIDAYECVCEVGWDGFNCEDDFDECISTPCFNGATCVDKGTVAFECNCAYGWEGTLCEHSIDPCARYEDDCDSRANCTHAGPGMHECTCTAGFAGTGQVCSDANECASNPCQNGGSCVDSGLFRRPPPNADGMRLQVTPLGEYACGCVNGWNGTNCEFDIDECTSDPCQHGGICSDTTSAPRDPCQLVGMTSCGTLSGCVAKALCDAIDQYACQCVGGWEGHDCELDIDECNSSPCANGAQCLDSVSGCAANSSACAPLGFVPGHGGCMPLPVLDSFACQCAPGFEGTLCTDDVDECLSDPCHNGAVCSESSTNAEVSIDSFSCLCAAGWANGLCTDPWLIPAECSGNATTVAGSPAECNGTADSLAGCQIADAVCAAVGTMMTHCGDACVPLGECAADSCEPVGMVVCGGACVPAGSAPLECGLTGGACPDGCDYQAPVPDFTPTCDVLHATDGTSQCAVGCDSVPAHFSPDCLVLEGGVCDTDIDECESSPCMNGGSCNESSACPVHNEDCGALNMFLWVDGAQRFCIPLLPIDAFACTCQRGFAGLVCDVDVNECASNPCANGATCFESSTTPDVAIDAYRCNCAPGFANGACTYDFVNEYSTECNVLESTQSATQSGNCDVDVDECLSNPCNNSAPCSDSTDDAAISVHAYRCSCTAGFADGFCDYGFIAEYTKACTIEESEYRAKCESLGGGFMSCGRDCIPATAGACRTFYGNCAVDVNECASNPCANGATCFESSTTPDVAIDAYRCNCAPGFANGACTYDFVNEYSTECNVLESTQSATQSGNCDVDVDECLSNPCNNSAPCSDSTDDAAISVHAYRCSCTAGFADGFCDYGFIAEYRIPCLVSQSDAATCESLGGGFLSCGSDCIPAVGICAQPLRGNCDIDVDECASTPCEHQAECLDSMTSAAVPQHAFSCTCQPGFANGLCEYDFIAEVAADCAVANSASGPSTGNCSLDVNECSSSPCQNGATCVESTVPDAVPVSVDAYRCVCAQGFANGVCGATNSPVHSTHYVAECGIMESTAGAGNCDLDVNECLSSPCAYDAGCHDSDVCRTGDRSSNDCSAVGMLSCGASCRPYDAHHFLPAIDDYGCDCRIGYEGSDCELDHNECLSFPCQNGVCSESCNSTLGPCAAAGMQECGASPGVCVPIAVEVDAFQCDCDSGWNGTYCDVDVDECISSPCFNGGTCTDSSVDATISIRAYSCACAPGFANGACAYAFISEYTAQCSVLESNAPFGSNCKIDVDECASNPCQNGATCADSTGTNSTIDPHVYQCSCAVGFANGVCEYEVIAEYDSWCSVNATVIDSAAGGNCDMDVDECASDPCENGAGCTDSRVNSDISTDAYRCSCSPGFANGACEYDFISEYTTECSVLESNGALGGNCDMDVDECASNPCQSGTCGDSASAGLNATGFDSFVCYCPPGLHGELCGLDVDECLSVPCQHLGNCTDSITSNSLDLDEFRCSCTSLYMGEVCQIERVFGCTDVKAANFNSSANTDDGSCDYALCTSAENDCHAYATCFKAASGERVCECNEGFFGDGVLCARIRRGCTNETAINFNPRANTDDGSCIFPEDVRPLPFRIARLFVTNAVV